jgi:hypothetical protein
MRAFIWRRLSPSMMVACIALLVALGGTSVAAVSALPRNSVGSLQLKNSAVIGTKIATNAVTSAKVKNGSLVTADFAPGQLGPGKLSLQTASVMVPRNHSSQTTASCPSGQQAVSGGATWTNKGDLQLTLVYSNPVYDPRAGDASGWVARGRNDTGQSREFTVQVLCGKKA